jgi:hypothetical protein
MKYIFKAVLYAAAIMLTSNGLQAQNSTTVEVTIENVAPSNGVTLTPVWVGFHSGSFDSYNGGLTSLIGLERLAEDGNNSIFSRQFLNFNPRLGGLTFIDNSRSTPRSRLVRTGDLSDIFRQDATMGPAPIQPGESVSQRFELRNDGSNDYFSYASMVLPTNDFFVANGNPLAHNISSLLETGGEVSFFIGTPNSGVNDAGTEREDFNFSAGNGLFPGRNLPAGQSRANQGRTTRRNIANVVGDPFENFQLISRQDRVRLIVASASVRRFVRLLSQFQFLPNVSSIIESIEDSLDAFEASVTIDVDGLNFNQYQDGIARVTISAVARDAGFSAMVEDAEVTDDAAFVEAADAGNLYFNIHSASFPGGEIRGQLDTVLADKKARGVRTLTLGAVLDAEQEPDGASDSDASGLASVTITVNRDGSATYSSDLSVNGIAVEELIPVAIFSAIHIHNAPRGVNGGVLQDFIVDAGGTETDFSVLQE